MRIWAGSMPAAASALMKPFSTIELSTMLERCREASASAVGA
jgi:hypothetical protein